MNIMLVLMQRFHLKQQSYLRDDKQLNLELIPIHFAPVNNIYMYKKDK